MSDLNFSDELLNYELGEELDEQTLLAGDDEDELLLSDEEYERNVGNIEKLKLKNDSENWLESKLQEPGELKSEIDKKLKEDIVTTSSVNESSELGNSSAELESDVSTSQETVRYTSLVAESFEVLSSSVSTCSSSKLNDEVSSTNNEPGMKKPFNVAVAPVSALHGLDSENIQSSQETVNTVEDITTEALEDPREDGEERSERTNIKQMCERDETAALQGATSDKYQPRFSSSKRGRGGPLLSGRGTSVGHFLGSRPPVRFQSFPPHFPPVPNENLNPQAGYHHPQYTSSDPSFGPGRPYVQNQMQQNYRLPPQHYRPQEFHMYGIRGPMNGAGGAVGLAPPYHQGYGQQGVSLRAMFRTDPSQISSSHSSGQQMRMRLPMHRLPAQNSNYIGIQSSIGAPSGSMLHSQIAGSAQPQQQQVLPRKVLINPNFKGGVEAATSQLMKDTQFMQSISSHVTHLQSDEELLRQQEEFINKNRKHIEKRRYERSPERNRSRERSYSPPRRQGNSREKREASRGRYRRGDSREFDSLKSVPKYRRDNNFDRRRDDEKKILEEEDEETRAYRQEIEKQKAMREKILKDKEMRRRKAAEDKIKEEEKPVTPAVNADEMPPAKLKPIIVTQSKIISLKKKSEASRHDQHKNQKNSSSGQNVQPIDQHTAGATSSRSNVPCAKILPATKRKITDLASSSSSIKSSSATLAVIKPVVKAAPAIVQTDDFLDDDDEFLDEERLLADTPSPPDHRSYSPNLTHPSSSQNNIKQSSAFSSSNRRVVLKSTASAADRDTSAHENADSDGQHDSNYLDYQELQKKGIFDRLDKKAGIIDANKRKLQRIVIKNSTE